MIPSYEDIMLPLLKVISDNGIYSYKDVEEELAKYFSLTDDEVNLKLQSGKRIFYSRINWAKTYLKNAGLIETPKRGQFNISTKGIELLKENINSLNSKYLLKYPEFSDYIKRGRKEVPKVEHDDSMSTVDDKTPIENIDNSFKELRSSLAEEILEKLKEVDFYKFEEIVLDLLIKMGYGGSREEAKKSTKKTNDGGIDGIINEDRLGLDRIYIQAKRWKDTVVGRPEIQKFSGALDTPGASKGIFITTSTFAENAIQYAKNISNKKIILIDGRQLAAYMIDFNVGVSTETIYEIKRVDTDYFIDE